MIKLKQTKKYHVINVKGRDVCLGARHHYVQPTSQSSLCDGAHQEDLWGNIKMCFIRG